MFHIITNEGMVYLFDGQHFFRPLSDSWLFNLSPSKVKSSLRKSTISMCQRLAETTGR
jgi:hypothetical protein